MGYYHLGGRIYNGSTERVSYTPDVRGGIYVELPPVGPGGRQGVERVQDRNLARVKALQSVS